MDIDFKSPTPQFPKCPSCGDDIAFKVSLRESLEAYEMSMTLTPEPGRLVAADTLIGAINAWIAGIKQAGSEMGHETEVVILGTVVNDEMQTVVRIAALPKPRPDSSGEAEGE